MSKPMDRGEGKVRISCELSEGEKLGTSNRKVRVKKCLDAHGIPCNLDKLPNIVVLGSGGGLRAMIAFLGTLEELQEQGLLDTIMYLCGVSGSTWCMSCLYKNGDWAEKLRDLKEHVSHTLAKSTWSLTTATKMLLRTAKDENYSLTDFWAYTIVYVMLHELDKGYLSDQRSASENGNNPYPIYAAVDEQRFNELTEYAPETWFEFTPHEAMFLGWGASVPTEYFGSEYKNGELKKKKEEKNMSYLKGAPGTLPPENWVFWGIPAYFNSCLWGSAIGSKKENKKAITGMLSVLRKKEKRPASPCRRLKGIAESFPIPNIESEAGDVEEQLQGDPPRCPSCCCSPGSLMDCAKMWFKTKYHLWKWKWGTNNNFLYKCRDIKEELRSGPARCSSCCCSSGNGQYSHVAKDKFIHLIDASVAINSAYPLILRPQRKVKLILSFDFSSGDPFETIKKTVKYCKKNNISFPEIDPKTIKETDDPSDCYIFRGKDGPTVMHFPLFNNVNCPGEIDIFWDKFPAFIFSHEETSIKDLLKKAGMNVANNKEKILQEIRNIVSSSA